MQDKSNSKDFIEFLSAHESPPEALSQLVLKDIAFSMKQKQIILKFLFFQFVGALFSLSVCPQFGLGLVPGHGIAHYFRMLGDFACASFCGSLFLSSGLMVSMIAMNSDELFWIWRRYKFQLIFIPAAFWFLLMLFNLTMSLPSETTIYHLAWILSAVIVQQLGMSLKNKFYSGILSPVRH